MDLNQIVDFFLIIVLISVAAINIHTYIQKERYKESGWLLLAATIIAIISSTWLWFKY